MVSVALSSNFCVFVLEETGLDATMILRGGCDPGIGCSERLYGILKTYFLSYTWNLLNDKENNTAWQSFLHFEVKVCLISLAASVEADNAEQGLLDPDESALELF